MKKLFELDTWQVSSVKALDRRTQSQAALKIKVNGQEIMEAAEGMGPVDALTNVLQKALKVFYPKVEQLILVDYLVHIVNSQKGTAAEVKVIIEIQKGNLSRLFTGVSTDILEASWQALEEGFSAFLIEEAS